MNHELENPRRERYFSDNVGDGEAERYPDGWCQTELKQVLKLDSLQWDCQKNDDRGMNNINGEAMLGQEPAELPLIIEEAAGKRDYAQAYSDSEGGVPKCVYGRLPMPITQ